MLKGPVKRFAFLASLLLLASPLLQGCGGCSRGGDGASDDDDDDGATPPVISSVVPSQGKTGVGVTVTGLNFGASQAGSTVLLGTVPVTPSTWSDTSLTLTVPAAAMPGGAPITVTVAGNVSNEGPFTVVLSAAAYVHNDNAPLTISGFAIATDGTLSELPGSPYATGGGTAGFGGDNSGLAIHPGRRLLFAALDTTLAVFSIDGTTGALTAVSGSPFSTGTTQNYGVSVTPDGGYVYVSGYGSSAVAALAIGSGGVLTPVAGSPFAGRVDGNPDGMLMHRDGGWLLVNQEALQGIDAWSVGADGTLLVASTNLHPAGAQQVYALEMHPTRDHLYGAGNSSAVAGYALDTVAGTLSALPGSPWTAASAGSPAITPDGNRLYVGQIGGSEIHGFSIAADGSLSALANSPYATVGVSGLYLDIGLDGQFVLAADEGGDMLYAFEIQAAGELLLVGSGGLPASADASDVLVTP